MPVRDFDFDGAIARLPNWIIVLAAIGTVIAGGFWGLAHAGGFLIGALAAYFNFRVIERAANRMTRLAGGGGRQPGRRTGLVLLIQFGIFVLAAFAIIELSGFNLAAAFCGFFVCPAAAIFEMVYELFRL